MNTIANSSNVRLSEATHPAAVVGLVFVIFIDLYFEMSGSYAALAASTALMFVLFHNFRHTPLAKILYFTAPSIYILPAIALIFVGTPINVAWFALFILSGYVLLHGSVNPATGRNLGQTDEPTGYNPFDLLAIIFFLSFGFLIAFGSTAEEGEGSPLIAALYFAAWSLGLLHLERLHRHGSNNQRIAGVAVYCVFMGLQMAFLWNGYGRIILVSLILAPLLLSSRYGPLRISAFALVLVATVLGFLGRVLRFGWSDGIAGLADDSGASHLVYSSEMWQQPSVAQNVTSFLDQYALLFAAWVPRDIWPSKPLGVNYSYVDVYIGRVGLSEVHSTAIGSFGEVLFFSQNYWMLLLGIVLLTLLVIRWVIVKLSGAFEAPAIMFDVWLLTYFWGGMASFASRAWYCIVPIVIYAVVLRRLNTSPAPRRAQVA
jgi:hypothetical protein